MESALFRKEEEKNRRNGMIMSIAIHAILLLILFFIIVWRAPNPPLPVYGVELNYGVDNEGSGDIQSTSTANTETNEEDSKPGEPESQPTPPTETAKETQEEVVTTTQESIVESTKETIKTPVVEKVKEPVKEVKEPTKEVKEVKETGNSGKDGTKDTKTGNNNGDDKDKVGDKGDPKGTIDGRSLYGTPGGGGGGGASINMAGWQWDKIPKPKDESTESGRIVFQIKIDDSGEIISVIPIEKTVSNAIVKFYQTEVEKLTFTKTAGDLTASTYTGTITFIIKSK
jgi:periplasmic protein TonB